MVIVTLLGGVWLVFWGAGGLALALMPPDGWGAALRGAWAVVHGAAALGGGWMIGEGLRQWRAKACRRR